MTPSASLQMSGLDHSEHPVMRRAPAAAAPTLVTTLTAPAIAAISLRHPLRNALLRTQPANISMAASPLTARRITHHRSPPT
jgi:hypothetical protein